MKRILIVSPSYPFPADRGDKRRILAFVKGLSRKYSVTLVSLYEEGQEIDAPEDHGVSCRSYRIKNTCGSIRAVLVSTFSWKSYREVKFWNKEFQEEVDRLLREETWDLVWINFVTMSGYIKKWMNYSYPEKKPLFILDQHNVDEVVWQKLFQKSRKLPRKIFALLQFKKLQHYQQIWYPKYQQILCVSKEDLEKTKIYLEDESCLIYAPNGVDPEYFVPLDVENLKRDQRKVLMYGGSMDVYMNQDAVMWFYQNVFDRIRAVIPDAEFWVIGRNPPAKIRNLASEGRVFVSGSVDDIREYYRKADVFIIPAQLGGGTKLKTLEAMSLALPIVSTPTGVQGIDIIDGRDLFVADAPEQFSRRVIELISDKDKGRDMGRAARDLIINQYSWENIITDIDAIINQNQDDHR